MVVFCKKELNTSKGESLMEESFAAAFSHLSVWGHPAWNNNANAFEISITLLYAITHRLKEAVVKTTIADIICGIQEVAPASRLAQYGDYRYTWFSREEQIHQVEDFDSSSDDVTRDSEKETEELFSHPSVTRAMDSLLEMMSNCLADVKWESWLLVLEQILLEVRHFGLSFHSKWRNILITMCAHYLQATRWNPNLYADIMSDMPFIINYEELHLVPITKEELLSIPQPCQNKLVSIKEEEELLKQLTSPSVRKLWYEGANVKETAHLCLPVAYALGMSNSEVTVTNFLKSVFVSKPEKISIKKAGSFLGSLIKDMNQEENLQLKHQHETEKNNSCDVNEYSRIPVEDTDSRADSSANGSNFRTGLFHQNYDDGKPNIVPNDSVSDEMNQAKLELGCNSQFLQIDRDKSSAQVCSVREFEGSKEQQPSKSSGSLPLESVRPEVTKSNDELKLEPCCYSKSPQNSLEEAKEPTTQQFTLALREEGSQRFSRASSDTGVHIATLNHSPLPGWPYITPAVRYPFMGGSTSAFPTCLYPQRLPQNVGTIRNKTVQTWNPLCAPPIIFPPPPTVGDSFSPHLIPALYKWNVPQPVNLTLCQQPTPQFHPLSSALIWAPDRVPWQLIPPPAPLYQCPRQILPNRETACKESAKTTVSESVNCTNFQHSALQSTIVLPEAAHKQHCTMTVVMHNPCITNQREQTFDQRVSLPLPNDRTNVGRQLYLTNYSKVSILPLASYVPALSRPSADMNQPVRWPLSHPCIKAKIENSILIGKKTRKESPFCTEEKNNEQRQFNEDRSSNVDKESLQKINRDLPQEKKIPDMYKILLREPKSEESGTDTLQKQTRKYAEK